MLTNQSLPPLQAVSLVGAPLPAHSFVVGGSAKSLGAMSAWRMLIEGSRPKEQVVSLFIDATPEHLRLILPPSRHPSCAAIAPDDPWHTFYTASPLFVMAVEGSLARVVVYGNVTEETLEAILSVA